VIKRSHWLNERGAGVLLHPTSLPSEEGIGVLGPHLEGFIEFLANASIAYWQILPLGPTGYGNSPYQSFSAFAGNPYLIYLGELLELGLLSREDLEPLRSLPQQRVDFGQIYRIKWPILRHAFRRFTESRRAYLPNYPIYEDFKEQHLHWLLPYARFMALKDRFGGKQWTLWPEPFNNYNLSAKQWKAADIDEAVEFHMFTQYLFAGQWMRVRQLARRRGVEIIGDVPIFVAMDSADVWSNRELFELEADGSPKVVAGVPPDYFAEDGQFWGNPLYRWEPMADDNYAWWISRFEHNFALSDIVRIDHFRGFEAYWEIPATATSAKAGRWRDAPGAALFKSLFDAHPEARIIAEDLGDIDDAVRQLRKDFGFPGMAVLQFAFDGDNKNLYLPHNLEADSILYTGTHDNDTTLGWYEQTSSDFQDQVRRYLRVSGEDVSWDFIRAAYRSTSKICIFPIQDVFALDSRARMNLPGSQSGNWEWRMTREQLQQQRESATYLAELAWLYGR